MSGFKDKNVASEAGKKSKRGPAKTTQEFRTVITEVLGKKSNKIEK